MKGLLTLFTFLPSFLSGYTTVAQQSPSRFSIVISPALLVPVSVAAQGGIQYRAGNRLSVLSEVAVPTFYPKNTNYEKMEMLRAGIEFKYFLKKDSAVSKYLSLQTSYLFREFMDQEQEYFYSKTQTFSYMNAVIKSPVLSSAVKLGLEVNAGKRTFFDVFVGGGLRFIFNEYKAKSVLLTSTQPPRQGLFEFDEAWRYNYTLMRLHGSAGIRFGVRL